MRIRIASQPDIPRVIELGSYSLKIGPYADKLADNPAVTTALAEKLLTMDTARIIVGEEDGQIQGIFAFVIFDHYFSGEKVAGEVIWFVSPECRKSGMPLELLWKAEQLASQLGAKHIQLTAPTDEIAAMYGKLKGFKKVETAFQRDISCR